MDITKQQDNLFNRNRIVTVLLVVLCLSFQSLAVGGIALFLPVIKQEFGFSFTQGGAISAASLLIYALMQIPSGYLSDRFGSKRLFSTGVLGVTILSFTLGLVTDYWQVVANQAVGGFFRALMFAPGMALLAGWFSKERRATALGLHLFGILFGQIVLNSSGPFIAAKHDWQFIFIVFSAVGIAVSFAYLFLGKESPSGPAHTVNMRDALQLLRERTIWYCNAIQYVRLAVFQGFAFWLPTLLVEEKGLSLQVTGLIIAARTVLIAPSSIAGSYLSDKLKTPTTVIGLSLAVLAVTTALIIEVQSISIVIALILINSLFIQLSFGPLFAIPSEKYGARITGTTSGIGNFFANLGSFTFAYLLGALKDASGSFESGFLAMVGACLFGLLFTVFLEMDRRKTAEQ